MDKEKGHVSIAQLALFSVGLTLASGVFSLSGDFAANGAHALAVIIGWIICGIGMLGLTMCFFKLGVVKTDLTSGLYTYAREGFGEYMGFNSAWGYLISAVLAYLSFVTLLFAALGNFFPVFGSGSNLASTVVASLILWLLVLLVLRGVNQSVAINAIVVVAKVIPILVMVLAIIFAGAFSWETFTHNMTGEGSGMSVFEQVKQTVYTTVWVFIGIEGAVVISGRARTTKEAGRATIISFLSLFFLYFIISVLSIGVMPHEELAALENPPMAGILEHVVGHWGAVLVSVGVIISLGGALLSYIILCVDSFFGPAQYDCFPALFAKQNKYKAPTWSIIISAIIIQLFLIIIYFNESTYQIVYALSTSTIMLPYVLSAFYYLKLVGKGEGLESKDDSKGVAWLIAIVGSIYGVWLLYASGVQYILCAFLFYGPGTLLYLYNRKKTNRPLFDTKKEGGYAIVVAILFITAIVMLTTGRLDVF